MHLRCCLGLEDVHDGVVNKRIQKDLLLLLVIFYHSRPRRRCERRCCSETGLCLQLRSPENHGIIDGSQLVGVFRAYLQQKGRREGRCRYRN